MPFFSRFLWFWPVVFSLVVLLSNTLGSGSPGEILEGRLSFFVVIWTGGAFRLLLLDRSCHPCIWPFTDGRRDPRLLVALRRSDDSLRSVGTAGCPG